MPIAPPPAPPVARPAVVATILQASVNGAVDIVLALLLIMGGQDHTVPEAVTRATLKQYRHSEAETDLIEFADRGHSLTVDHGWRDVAEACQQWLQARDL